jgi:hypothetical protein
MAAPRASAAVAAAARRKRGPRRGRTADRRDPKSAARRRNTGICRHKGNRKLNSINGAKFVTLHLIRL